ncbi:hypothetical protein [Schleiferilactobacillus perolens]|jgi:hypothetical protein|uniref:Lipoprotein n=1 Tax=Schleiferilactobacillus perolens DSM 12744 TaxID=1423792 RepID=A0A0R1MVR9_9LACO|nr:hypothetical protein [Schleiferilactobacillus perolens]KRL12223.1 hypothetical protein FD09_GL003093 [Schleiferilactobacillus perolens DSM 12744]MCI2172133.1 hypothetical protein [Schleiferilactobacillus perolens]
MRHTLWGKIVFLGMAFTLLLAGLSACEPKPLTDKAQLKNTATTVYRTIREQRNEITTITNSLEKSQSLYVTEHKQKPNENLLKNKQSDVYQNFTTRTDAVAKLTAAYKKLTTAEDTLNTLAKSKAPNLPTEKIQDLGQSLKIISLDHTTFSQFMDEFTKAEQSFYADTADMNDEKDLDTANGRFSQYYGALFQQMEIMQANLTTASQQSKELLAELK